LSSSAANRARPPTRGGARKINEKSKTAPPEARRDELVPPALASRMLSIGYGNLVSAARVVAVVSPSSSPMRRLREQATQRGKLIDATEGRRTRSIIITDSDHIILSAINPETIAARLAPDEGAGT